MEAKEMILKRLLMEKKISYTKLSAMTGMSRNMINMLMNGRTQFNDENLKLILDACGISVEEFNQMDLDKDEILSTRSRYKYDGKKLTTYVTQLELRVKELEKELKMMAEKLVIYEKFIRYIEENKPENTKNVQKMH